MSRRPILRLPTVDGLEPVIGPVDAAGMTVFLSDVNSESIRSRIGHEKVVARAHVNEESFRGTLEITRGEDFPMRRGVVRGMRYLLRDETSRIVAAVNVSRTASQAIISNIVVDEGWRRRGLAAFLVHRVHEDYSELVVSNAMSHEGAALFGYDEHAARRAAPAAPPR